MTTQAATQDELYCTLEQIEALQLRETAVLRSMDRPALDAITAEKEVLGARLNEIATRQRPSAHHRPLIERVRRQATLNQLLLVHARDAVRTILSQTTGASFEQLPNQRRLGAQEGLRLNVRG